MPLLQIEDLYINFGGVIAIDSLSFSIEKGQIFGLIGPNGAGKTTAFNCIVRYHQPGRGRILFNGESLLELNPNEIIRKGIGRTFQNLELFPSMTVQDNLLVGIHYLLKTNILMFPGYWKYTETFAKPITFWRTHSLLSTLIWGQVPWLFTWEGNLNLPGIQFGLMKNVLVPVNSKAFITMKIITGGNFIRTC